MRNAAGVILIIIFFFATAKGQVSLNTLAQKYNSFKTALPGVRIQLVFNQDRYAPGDTVFFKAYFLKEDLHPVEGRQLINLSLVSPEGNTIQQYMFAAINGIGENQLILPEYLKPGIYNVATYSSWMKNYESAKAFNQDLIVVGETTIEKVPDRNSSSSVHVAVSPASDIRITSPPGSLLRYNELYLIVVNNGKIIHSRSFIQGIDDVVSLPVDEFPTGVSVIHVINKIGRELGTALHYVPVRDTVTATVKIRRPNVQTRRNAAISVTVQDGDGKPVEGEFSVSVFNGTVLDSSRVSFQRALALNTPSYEPWRQILYGTAKQKYDFTTNIWKKGTAYYEDGRTPLPVLTRLFLYLQENDMVMQSLIMAGGKVSLSLPDVSGNDVLFYMADSEGKEIPNIKIVWKDATLPVSPPPPSVETTEGDVYGIFAANRRVIDEAFGFAEGERVDVKAITAREPSELETRLRGADLTVHPDKFVTFNTMTEMAQEIIPALNVFRQKGKMRVRMGLQKGVVDSEPLYIIDGIATKNTEYFLSLKPIDIDRVKLVTNPGKLAMIGPMGKSGVVIVETKTGQFQPTLDPSTVINGVKKPFDFPTSSFTDKHKPYFKSTIYWNPSIKTDPLGRAIVEFECSDDLGPVYIRVNGMTTDGRPFSGQGKLNFVLSEK